MANNIEIEAKILVTEEGYEKIKNYFDLSDVDKIIQTNHYIDSDNKDLRKLGFALRIREKSKTCELTLKTPLAEGLLEKSHYITKDEYHAFKTSNIFPEGEIKSFLIMLGINVPSLKIITSLTTERFNYRYSEDGLMSLDKSTYNGLVDYEVEMEETGMDLATGHLKEICEKVGIEYVPNTMSKQARAMNSVKK